MNITGIFDSIRAILGGHLNQVQVDCINAILEACKKHNVTDNSHIAYILATGCHECDMKPVIENLESRKGRPYNNPDPVTGKTYYGRGCPAQITWKANYKTFGDLLHIDLVNHPELALQVDTGAEIGVIGMSKGMFTGVGLSKYFNATVNDPLGARRTVNGQDNAQRIAGLYERILEGMKQNNAAV